MEFVVPATEPEVVYHWYVTGLASGAALTAATEKVYCCPAVSEMELGIFDVNDGVASIPAAKAVADSVNIIAAAMISVNTARIQVFFILFSSS